GTWTTTVGPFHVNLAGAPGQTVLMAEGPDKDQVALARQVGETAHFAASYGMEAWHNDVRSIRLLPTGNPDLTAVEAVQANGMTTLVVVAHTPGAWTAAGWTSDARVLIVRGLEGGGKPEVLAAGGTFGRRGGE
nr:hypothetical protein [Armatimonadota bacterium]